MDDSKISPFGPKKRKGLKRYESIQEQDNATSVAKVEHMRGTPERSVEGDFESEIVEDSNENTQLTDDEENIRQDTCEPEKPPVQPKAESPKLKPRPATKHPEPSSQSNDKKFIYFTVVSVVLVASVVVIVLGLRYLLEYRLKKTPKRSSCDDFLQLSSKYPNTDDMLWSTLIVGVNRSINQDPGEPATFIFLYNSSNVGKLLLDDVTRIAIKCFGTDGAIWRTSNYYQSAEIAQDYGNVLDRHREELKSKGVLVVQDLDRVPPTAAKIFFTICDSYEPLVNKAVIFFTIDISRQPTQVVQPERSATAIAEGILKDLWRGELNPNVLDPLVVRLTESVFRID